MTDQQTSDESTELDALIGEYEPPGIAPALAADINTLADSVRTTQQTDAAKAVTDAVADAVKVIKQDDALKDVPDNDIQDFLEGEGRRDSSINDAFQNRVANPSDWDQARSTVQKRFTEKMTNTDANDVAAAQASVRGMTSTVPDETPYRNTAKEVADIIGMSDVELENYKQKVIAEQKSG